MKRKLKEWC